ncbi:MAG TPA: MobA/MobL family protein [Clostridiales bacterium]|nr:MobA/MobL family protein [Clostridiales bacterium]
MTSVACPHFDVSIRQRSKGQSAVAGAAYMSAEKLFCEYDQRTKNFCYKQKEIVAKGILLPPNAPREYTDRQTLWNAVEASEKQWNAQLARGIIMALPRELPADQYESLVREYCMEQFVLRGMIVDYAIHDKGDGNPHAHVMLTMRAMDEHGKWLPKARRVYILDENGEKIPLPNGDYKTRKERTTDWDDSGNCERWRTAWADTTNRYLERAGADVRLDLRSYERQGVDLVPTVHMGPVVTYLEQQGIRTEIGQYNEEIKQFNRVLQSLKIRLASLKKWLAEAIRKTAEIMKPEPYQPSVMEYIQVFQNLRRAERADWSKTAKQTAGINDLKFAAQVQFFMQEAGISTLQDFDEFVGKQQESLTQLDGVGKAIRKKQTALKHLETFQRLKPISDKSKRGMGFMRKQYAEKHHQELNDFAKAVRYMNANGIKAADHERIANELQQLLDEQAQLRAALAEQNVDPDLIDRIRYCVDTVIKAGEEPRQRESIRAQLQLAKAQQTKPESEKVKSEPYADIS